jgi:undecaprenyl-diphosphatase
MDLFVFRVINNFSQKSKITDFFGIFFAKYFEFILWLIFLLFFYDNTQVLVLVIGISIFSRFVIALPIGFVWGRKRPYKLLNIKSLISEPWWFSFPSGHASFYFAFATAILFLNFLLGLFFLISAFLISLARVYCGVHWPSDVLVGGIIGILCGLFFFWLYNI